MILVWGRVALAILTASSANVVHAQPTTIKTPDLPTAPNVGRNDSKLCVQSRATVRCSMDQLLRTIQPSDVPSNQDVSGSISSQHVTVPSSHLARTMAEWAADVPTPADFLGWGQTVQQLLSAQIDASAMLGTLGNTGGGRIPCGHYRVNNGFPVRNGLIGAGSDCVTLQSYVVKGDIIDVPPDATNLRISGFKIWSMVPQIGGAAIHIQGGNNIHLDDITTAGSPAQFHTIYQLDQSANTTFLNNFLFTNASGPCIQLSGTGTAELVIETHMVDSRGRRNTLMQENAMADRKRRSARSGRAPLVSPGRPPVAGRAEQRRFWAGIATGLSSEDAAIGAGVPQAVGTRWFRKAGGMAPAMFGRSAKPLSGRYLSLAEREELAILRAQGTGIREIARRVRRSASTVSREMRRNAARRSGGLEYRATVAQWHAERAARRPKAAKLAVNAALRTYVQDRLSGVIAVPCGAAVPGPTVPWKGRRHGRRQDRRWAKAWSPQQIAHRLRLDFPGDVTMRISHEAIYQSLYVQGRGALRRELTACLRTGRALRVPRERSRRRGKSFIVPEVMISERPAEAADRAVPGHWEGDLILGLGSSAIGTLVERTTRFTMLLHLPRMDGHGSGPRVKNGPALAGHGAEAVRDAIASTITTLPEQLRQSLTWDQGAEMAQHAQLRTDTGVAVYFCDPHSPWQRGTNENTNGLLRQYFPKGTDLSLHSAGDLAAVASTLNGRPRKTLGWKTPAEALDAVLQSVQAGVAMTG